MPIHITGAEKLLSKSTALMLLAGGINYKMIVMYMAKTIKTVNLAWLDLSMLHISQESHNAFNISKSISISSNTKCAKIDNVIL